MATDEEIAYADGARMAFRRLLQECVRQLGVEEDLVAAQAAWLLERTRAITVLRGLCRIHGDNDWPDDGDLGDILENHLGAYLDARTPERPRP